jgi:hypothetical protein
LEHKYQLIFIGQDFGIEEKIIEKFYEKLNELGVEKKHLKIINSQNFIDYSDRNPAFCVYMGHEPVQESASKNPTYKDEKIAELLIHDATLILPVIEGHLDSFNQFIPECLRPFNGMTAYDGVETAVAKIVSNILEGFSLLRKSRRIFISYKRNESTGVAIQLYERLGAHGFDVFLDTHSIQKNEPFQDELWHRMTDSDVVVLLSTSNFLQSEWSKEELARASSLSLGIVQFVWPNAHLVGEAQICLPIKLNNHDFVNEVFLSKDAKLENAIVELAVSEIESIRARTLAARQDNLTSEFIKYANIYGVKAILDSHKFITLHKGDKEIIVIPTIGIPQSFTCNQSQELVREIKKKDFDEIYLLYDQIHIRDYWLSHLNWLNQYLPVRTKELQKVKAWLNS